MLKINIFSHIPQRVQNRVYGYCPKIVQMPLLKRTNHRDPGKRLAPTSGISWKCFPSHAKADYKTKISGCKPLSVISTRNNPTVDLKMVGLEVEVFHLPIKEERWSYVESKLHQQCNARSVEGEEMGRAHRWRRPQRFDSRCLSCPWRPLCCRA